MISPQPREGTRTMLDDGRQAFSTLWMGLGNDGLHPDEGGKTARETFQLVNQIVNNRIKTDDGVVTKVEGGETSGPKATQRRVDALVSHALKAWKRCCALTGCLIVCFD